MSLNRKTLYKSRFYDEINDIIDFINENSTQGAIKFAQGIKPIIEKSLNTQKPIPSSVKYQLKEIGIDTNFIKNDIKSFLKF